MKQPFPHLALIAAFALCLFCRHENREAPPATIAPLPLCDSSLILAVQDWLSELKNTTADSAALNLEKILQNKSVCYDWVVAEAWHKLGNKYENIDHSKARKYFQKALSLRLPVLGGRHKDVLRSTHMIGSMYAEEKDYHTALIYYDSVGMCYDNADRQTKESAVMPYIRNLMMKGIAYMELKELSRSKMYLQMACDSIRGKNYIADFWLSHSLTQYSSCCRLMHQFKEAIETGKESLNWTAVADKPLMAEAGANLAIGNAYQDSAFHCKESTLKEALSQQAIIYTRRAKDLYQQIEYKSGMIAVGNLSEVYRRLGKPDEAQQVLNQILDTFSIKKAPELAQFYMIRGKTWIDKHQFTNALVDCEAALSCLVPAYQSNGVLPSLALPTQNRFDLMELLGDMASAHLSQFNISSDTTYLNSAATTFDTLLNLLNQIRGDFLSDEAKIELAGDARNILDKAFGGYLQLYRRTKEEKYLERAFNISEQRKSFALLEAARLNNADAALPDSLRQKKRALAKEKSAIEQRMVANWNHADSIRNLTREQLRNLEQGRVLQQDIKKRYPRYYAFKQKGADLDVGYIQQKMLGEDQALLEYFCRDTVLGIFLVTRAGFQYFESPIERTGFTNTVSDFIQLAARPGSGGEIDAGREERLCSKAHELYLILLNALPKDLPKRLIIIPDAPFLTLPFEALAIKPAATGGIRRLIEEENFVLFKHSISYCFSANLLREMQQSEMPAQINSDVVAAFAPRFPEHLAQGPNLPVSFGQAVQALRPLGNQREIQDIIKKNISVHAYTDSLASKHNFWEACKRNAFVHVATHGILNQDPNLNFIAFSQNGDTLDQNELLFLRELYAEHLPQELIVFSACETTLGQFREGEGNISMARGLAYSGVRSFITTLWKVPTDANRQIMPEFYELFLSKKKSKDVALAEARRAFIAASPANAQPNQWAGLVLIGSTERSTQSTWVRWAIAATALAGLFLFWAYRRRRKASLK